MTPATIIRKAQSDGVVLSLSTSGTVKAAGNPEAVQRWLGPMREHRAGIVVALQAGTSRWWRLRYPDRDPLEVACCPDATYADILKHYPEAVEAEAFTPTLIDPSAPLTASEEGAIRAWLAWIGENDPDTVAEVLDGCRRGAKARAYFVGRALIEVLK